MSKEAIKEFILFTLGILALVSTGELLFIHFNLYPNLVPSEYVLIYDVFILLFFICGIFFPQKTMNTNRKYFVTIWMLIPFVNLFLIREVYLVTGYYLDFVSIWILEKTGLI